MATRLLLTLLALLTGLSAQLSPAQARIRAEGASAVGVLNATAQSERGAAVRPYVTTQPAERRWSQRQCSVAMPRYEGYCAPSVMLRIDRARE